MHIWKISKWNSISFEFLIYKNVTYSAKNTHKIHIKLCSVWESLIITSHRARVTRWRQESLDYSYNCNFFLFPFSFCQFKPDSCFVVHHVKECSLLRSFRWHQHLVGQSRNDYFKWTNQLFHLKWLKDTKPPSKFQFDCVSFLLLFFFGFRSIEECTLLFPHIYAPKCVHARSISLESKWTRRENGKNLKYGEEKIYNIFGSIIFVVNWIIWDWSYQILEMKSNGSYHFESIVEFQVFFLFLSYFLSSINPSFREKKKNL